MAIIKSFETPQGVTATYNKVLKAEINALSMSVECTIAVYASPEKRESGSTVLWHEYISIPFSALTQDPRDLLYSILEVFSGSYLFGGISDAVATTQTAPAIQLAPLKETAPSVAESPVSTAPLNTPVVSVVPVTTLQPLPQPLPSL